jgi:hypothetical protein
MSFRLKSFLLAAAVAALISARLLCAAQQDSGAKYWYLRLTQPRHVLSEAQAWEGNEYPHTLSVLELKRDGFRYWGWYGLNEGKGIVLDKIRT